MEEKKLLDTLREYVYDQDVQGLQQSLKKWPKLNLNQYNQGEHTLLHIAAQVEHSESMIRFLVQQGIPINALDNQGRTPLYDAVLYTCPENLKVLIELGGDVNLSSFQPSSPLVVACCHKADDFTCVNILLENGAAINASSKNHLSNRTALEAAVYSAQNLALVQFLIEKGADPNVEAPLMKAISRKNEAMVQLLVEQGAIINHYTNINGENDVAFAKRVGNQAIVQYLESKL